MILLGSTATVWQTSNLSLPHIDNQNKVNFSEPEYIPPQTLENAYTKTTTQTFQNMSISNNFNAGLSSLKKGFSSLATSIDSALKPSPDDMSDTLSIRSDASSDSEKYVIVPANDERNTETVDSMFYVSEFCYENRTTVEIASEVMEEESSITSASDHSFASSCRRKDLVSLT